MLPPPLARARAAIAATSGARRASGGARPKAHAGTQGACVAGCGRHRLPRAHQRRNDMANMTWWRRPSNLTLRRDMEDILDEFDLPRGFRREIERVFGEDL